MGRSTNRWLLRGRFLATGALGSLLVVLVVLATTARHSGSKPLVWLVGSVFVVVAVLTLVGATQVFLGVVPATWMQSRALASDELAQRLLARWLSRARWARAVGATCGLALFAFGPGPPNFLLWGLGGVAFGGLLAELRPFHGRDRSAATASLDRRAVTAYLEPVARWAQLLATAVAVVALAGAVRDGGAPARWATAACAVSAVVVLAQLMVTRRPRPALSLALQQADDLARWLAVSRGLAVPGAMLTLVLAGQAMGDGMGFLCYSAAMFLWWHNRNLGLATPMLGRAVAP